MTEEKLERKLLRLTVGELIRRLESPEEASTMSAAEFSVIRGFVNDTGMTLSDIVAGNFGEVAKGVAEQVMKENEGLPFDVNAMPQGLH